MSMAVKKSDEVRSSYPKRRPSSWAVKPLTRAVNRISVVQSQQVDGLKRTLQKVRLDKQILLNEKLEAIW